MYDNNLERYDLDKIMNNDIDKFFKELDKKCGGKISTALIYIYIRYGLYEYNIYMDDADISKIIEIIEDYDSIFNEDLNDRINNLLYDREVD